MLLKQRQAPSTSSKHFSVSLARNVADVREAQRLRFRVFAEEMGAQVPSREQGIDCDLYDAYCDHLLVRDTVSGEVVGTYRILTGAQARRIGGFYSDEEFDLTRLGHLRDHLVEVGRSCVHPDYRSGCAISMLWSGLGAYVLRNGYRYLMGCASLPMTDGGAYAARVYRSISRDHQSPPEYRVFPRIDLPLSHLERGAPANLRAGSKDVQAPPLVKGYLRLGAYVCGEPAWDPDFNTADLLVLLPLDRVDSRYARHFLKP